MTYAVSRESSNRSPLKITSNDAPMSAAMAAQRDAWPANVSITKRAFTPSENVMFCRMMDKVRREWQMSQGSFAKSSDIRAMSAVSIAASLPAAPIAIPSDARPKAGASFTPSPTIATRPYLPTRASTTLTLSSGRSSA